MLRLGRAYPLYAACFHNSNHTVTDHATLLLGHCAAVKVRKKLDGTMFEECCPKAARVLGEAEPDALACLDPRGSTGGARARTTCGSVPTGRSSAGRRCYRCSPRRRRRPAWWGRCCASGTRSGRGRAASRRGGRPGSTGTDPSPSRRPRSAERGLRLVAEQAIKASPALADGMKAAWDAGKDLRSHRRPARSAGTSPALAHGSTPTFTTLLAYRIRRNQVQELFESFWI